LQAKDGDYATQKTYHVNSPRRRERRSCMMISHNAETDRIPVLRQQIRQYLAEPCFSNGLTREAPLFDGCILWKCRTQTPIAGCGSAAKELAALLTHWALCGKLAKPQRNTKSLYATDTGCVMLSFEFFEASDLLVAVSFPIDVKAVAEVCKAFVPRLSVHLSDEKACEKAVDGVQIMRLGMLFDLIAAARDELLPINHRAEALAAIFGISDDVPELTKLASPSDPSALVPLLCSLLETASKSCEGSNLYEKV
jgi:hypothetical protein